MSDDPIRAAAEKALDAWHDLHGKAILNDDLHPWWHDAERAFWELENVLRPLRRVGAESSREQE